MKSIRFLPFIVLNLLMASNMWAGDFKNFKVADLMSAQKIAGTQRIAPEFMGRKFGKDVSVFELEIMPHSFRAFKLAPLVP